MTTMSNMYLHTKLFISVVDELVFLGTDRYQFLLNIAYRTFRTIGTTVDIKQYKGCGNMSNIY